VKLVRVMRFDFSQYRGRRIAVNVRAQRRVLPKLPSDLLNRRWLAIEQTMFVTLCRLCPLHRLCLPQVVR